MMSSASFFSSCCSSSASRNCSPLSTNRPCCKGSCKSPPPSRPPALPPSRPPALPPLACLPASTRRCRTGDAGAPLLPLVCPPRSSSRSSAVARRCRTGERERTPSPAGSWCAAAPRFILFHVLYFCTDQTQFTLIEYLAIMVANAASSMRCCLRACCMCECA